jgi:hypothetical protein
MERVKIIMKVITLIKIFKKEPFFMGIATEIS